MDLPFGTGTGPDRLNRGTLSAIRRPRTSVPFSTATSQSGGVDNSIATLGSTISNAAANYNANALSSNEFLLFAADDRIDDKCNSGSTNSSTQQQQHLTSFGGSKEPLKMLEALDVSVNNGNLDPQLIYDVCQYLKQHGSYLDESPYKDQIDLYFNSLRNITRDNRLDPLSRSRLLELIELRAMNWISSEELSSFYGRKLSELETMASTFNLNANMSNLELTNSPSFASFRANSPTTNLPTLSAVEFIRPSGKYSKPAKVPGKNFVKDEFVIRNSDSGKVMGIKGRRVHLIEELSDTVISFQRVNPGAKERLLQITGPTGDSISRAKCYIEDTIKRNASPVPFDQGTLGSSQFQSSPFGSSLHAAAVGPNANANVLSRSSSATNNTDNSYGNPVSTMAGNGLPHVQTVYVASDVVVVSSNSSSLADQAKVVLDQYFNSNGNPGGNRTARDSLGSVFERKSMGGYEASESSDSEIYVNTSREGGQRAGGGLFNKSVGSALIGQQAKQQSNSGAFNLSRQSSFHTTGLVVSSSTANAPLSLGATGPFKTSTLADDSERGALWRSASQGSFLSGRSSLRYMNVDFDHLDCGEFAENPTSSTPVGHQQQSQPQEPHPIMGVGQCSPQKHQQPQQQPEQPNCSQEQYSNWEASRGFPPGFDFDRMKAEMPDVVVKQQQDSIE